LRASRKSFEQESSDRDEISDGYSTNGGWHPRDEKVKRRQLHHPRKESSRSPSPIHPWEEGVETAPPTQSQSSEKETDSQLPCSEGQDSQSEVDWESVLRDDIEMFDSNWEAEFLVDQAKIMACSDDRDPLPDEPIQGNEDEPWYPYDPESILSDNHIELHNDSVNDELEGEKLICFGVVSVLSTLSCRCILYQLRSKTGKHRVISVMNTHIFMILYSNLWSLCNPCCLRSSGFFFVAITAYNCLQYYHHIYTT
jgi:hypothetical protein